MLLLKIIWSQDLFSCKEPQCLVSLIFDRQLVRYILIRVRLEGWYDVMGRKRRMATGNLVGLLR